MCFLKKKSFSLYTPIAARKWKRKTVHLQPENESAKQHICSQKTKIDLFVAREQKTRVVFSET